MVSDCLGEGVEEEGEGAETEQCRGGDQQQSGVDRYQTAREVCEEQPSKQSTLNSRTDLDFLSSRLTLMLLCSKELYNGDKRIEGNHKIIYV